MPINGDYNVVVFGDSVMWGQGLRESEKIHTRVIEGLTKRFPGRTVRLIGNSAHSGAIIGLKKDGSRDIGTPPNVTSGTRQEVNYSYPTILDQLDQFQGKADTIGLILLNGGINDVNVRTILPSINDNDLTRRTRQACYSDMKVLLAQALQKFPNAQIVVSGYYPIISEDTIPQNVKLFLEAHDLWPTVCLLMGIANPAGAVTQGMFELIRQRLAANCALFHTVSDSALAQAVDEVNRESASQPKAARRVHVMSPNFDRENAVFTMFSLLFGVDNVSAPVDPPQVRDGRIRACNEAYANDVVGCQVCCRASAGHPNPQGAQRYADEILAVLDGAGVTGVSRQFSRGFLWGTATAAYQVEGGITNNDWQTFTTNQSIKDRVHLLGTPAGFDINLAPAGDAVGHGDRATLVADLDRMVALGMNAYRFSIEWSRVEPHKPQNSADVNSAALAYYDFVLDEVKKRGMEPVVTLNHLTLPQWVLTPPTNTLVPEFDSSFNNSLRGWESGATISAFVEFVGRMSRHFRTKIKYWVTLNEPVASMIGIGYIAGLWSPGMSNGVRAQNAYFNLLKAHVYAYDKLKDPVQGDPSARVGIAHAMMYAKSLDIRDVSPILGDCPDTALRQFNYFFNWHFLDSLTRPKINLTLDVGNRNPQSMTNAIQNGLDRAQRNFDAQQEEIRRRLQAADKALEDFKEWLTGASRRDAIFDKWREEFGDLAANAVSFGGAQARSLARSTAEGAVNFVDSALKLIIDDLLASIVTGVQSIIEDAESVSEAETEIGDRIFRIIRRDVMSPLDDLGIPSNISLPSAQTLATAARDVIEGLSNFRTFLEDAVKALSDQRAAERLLPDLLRARDNFRAALHTLLTNTATSDDFFGVPFKRRLDFLGINYYRAASIHTGPMFLVPQAMGAGYVGGIFTQNYADAPDQHHAVLNDLSWEVYPQGLYKLLKDVDAQYQLPVLITENGMAEEIDRNRAPYIVAHLEALHRAHREGVNVLGYLHWSICDNFEWFENYNPKARFGLFTIDRASTPHRREITEAAFALSLAIAENGITGLADRFGSFHPLGRTVTSPLLSPVRTFRGKFGPGQPFLDNEQFALYLVPTSNGVTGLMFFGRDGSWHRLSVTLGAQGSISFSLPRPNGAPGNPLTVSGTIIGGEFSGGVEGANPKSSQTLTAKLDSVVGNWIGNLAPRVLQVFRPQLQPSLSRIKSLRTTNQQSSWQATFDSNAAGSLNSIACVFTNPTRPGITEFSLAANIDPANGQLAGTLQIAKAPARWTAQRLPDGLPPL
jgi:beta-glucosidase/6-phospho-beta-glucosidase/beta-galactosidase/lysophospholipase L1-like esterase